MPSKSELIRACRDVLTVAEMAEQCDCSVDYVRRVLRKSQSKKVNRQRLVCTSLGADREAEKVRARNRRRAQGVHA